MWLSNDNFGKKFQELVFYSDYTELLHQQFLHQQTEKELEARDSQIFTQSTYIQRHSLFTTHKNIYSYKVASLLMMSVNCAKSK